jgi:hypothetical protein
MYPMKPEWGLDEDYLNSWSALVRRSNRKAARGNIADHGVGSPLASACRLDEAVGQPAMSAVSAHIHQAYSYWCIIRY